MTARQKVSVMEERAAKTEIKITCTLITVVIMFLVCQLPTATTLIYKIFHVTKMGSNEEAVLRALGNIFNFLVSLNAACNFLLYCALSDKYRRTFMWTFFRCFYQQSSAIRSRAFFTHQVEGPNGVQYVNRRSITRRNPTFEPLNRASSKKQTRSHFPTGHRTRRSTDCYIITLPAISGIFYTSFLVKINTVLYYRAH